MRCGLRVLGSQFYYRVRLNSGMAMPRVIAAKIVRKTMSPHTGGSHRFLQQETLETIYSVSKGIGSCDCLQPLRKCLNGIDRSAGEEQQRVENAKHRLQRILDAHHEEHHGVERERREHNHDEQTEYVR